MTLDLTEKHRWAKLYLELHYSIRNAPPHAPSNLIHFAGCANEAEAQRIEADLCDAGMISFVPTCKRVFSTDGETV